MKKALLTTVIMVVMLIPAMILAENPDSRPSISFAIGGDLVSGKNSRLGFNQDNDGQHFGFSGKLALPISNDVTLGFWLGFATGETKWERTFVFYEQASNYNRFSFDFKVKFYIGNSINK